jgi:hypothetical protein
MEAGLEIPIGEHEQTRTISGVIVDIHRVGITRWLIEKESRHPETRVYEIHYDASLPLDAWSVHPAEQEQIWQTFPDWAAALRFASVL